MGKVLIVGQTPPPIHGQSTMIERILGGDYGSIKLHHVRMEFSDNLTDVGSFSPKKIVKLFDLILTVVIARYKYKISVLYYPPAGPNIIPIIRDIIFLISTRWMFEKTIFHFHASNLTSIYDQLPKILRLLFRKAFFYPDAVIRLSKYSPEDGKLLNTRREFIVPYGIEDNYERCLTKNVKSSQNQVTILFAGAIRETKGVNILLEASKILAERGYSFSIRMMGRVVTNSYHQYVRKYIAENRLEKYVELLGELQSQDKWEEFANANIFCFPTFYESEAFSVVLLEALSFNLPIVTTNWRGIPSIVDDGQNGFLVPIKDYEAVSERLSTLIENENLRKEMGDYGRNKYLNNFTIDKYQQELRKVLSEIIVE